MHNVSHELPSARRLSLLACFTICRTVADTAEQFHTALHTSIHWQTCEAVCVYVTTVASTAVHASQFLLLFMVAGRKAGMPFGSRAARSFICMLLRKPRTTPACSASCTLQSASMSQPCHAHHLLAHPYAQIRQRVYMHVCMLLIMTEAHTCRYRLCQGSGSRRMLPYGRCLTRSLSGPARAGARRRARKPAVKSR